MLCSPCAHQTFVAPCMAGMDTSGHAHLTEQKLLAITRIKLVALVHNIIHPSNQSVCHAAAFATETSPNLLDICEKRC